MNYCDFGFNFVELFMSALILLIIAIRRDDDCVRAIVMQTFANTNITYERFNIESAVECRWQTDGRIF